MQLQSTREYFIEEKYTSASESYGKMERPGESWLQRKFSVIFNPVLDVLWCFVLGKTWKLEHQVSVTPKMNVQDMDDHVLREIFEYLDVIDLTSIADVCSVFKRNAQTEFFVRYRTKPFYIEVRSNDVATDFKYNEIHLRRLPAIMRNFGTLIHTLEIVLCETARRWSPNVMELVSQHCAGTLCQFGLHQFLLTNEIIPTIRPLLSRLHKLELCNCFWDLEFDVSTMFSKCTELQELELWGIRNLNYEYVDFNLRSNVPKLQSICVTSCGLRKRSIVKFLKANHQLKEIEILGCKRITSRIIQPIVQYTPQIETLRFTSNVFTQDLYANAKLLEKLTSLKSLQIDGFNRCISPIIRQVSVARLPLECLLLWQFEFDKELIAVMTEMKKLKELVLIAGSNMKVTDVIGIIKNIDELTDMTLFDVDTLEPTDLPEIIRCAPKLRSLKFRLPYDVSDSVLLDPDIYQDILRAIGDRKAKNRLELVLRPYPHHTIDVPMELLKSNESLLKIYY